MAESYCVDDEIFGLWRRETPRQTLAEPQIELAVLRDHHGSSLQNDPNPVQLNRRKIKYLALVAFMVSDLAWIGTDELTTLTPANPEALLVIAEGTVFCTSLLANLSMFGARETIRNFFNFTMFGRWMLLAIAGAWGSRYLVITQMKYPALVTLTIEALYLPLVILSSFLLNLRSYGNLERLSLAMLVLATISFIWLRERCKAGSCLHGTNQESRSAGLTWSTSLSLLSAVSVGAMVHVFGEQFLKNRSTGCFSAVSTTRLFLTHKLHYSFCCACVYVAMWCIDHDTHDVLWIGTWTPTQWLVVFAMVGSSWSGDLVLRLYNAISRGVATTLNNTLARCILDLVRVRPLQLRMIPSVCMTLISILSGVIFIAGRHSLRNFEKHTRQVTRRGQRSDASVVAESEEKASQKHRTLQAVVIQHWPLIAYVFTDASRTLVQVLALGRSNMTPQSMAIAANAVSLLLYTTLITRHADEGNRLQSLRHALQLPKVVRFIPCGLLFASTNAFVSMAMGMGMSGSLAVVIGKVYTPICAVGSYLFLDNVYILLEWSAISIITLASAAFGALKNMDPAASSASLKGILLVVLAASTSAGNSLVMEKLLKVESDNFITNKIRIDVGCLLFSIVFLPVMGLLAGDGFPKGAFWRYRPLVTQCEEVGHCSGRDFQYGTWDESRFVSHPEYKELEYLECSCGRGVFVCWDNPMIYILLIVNVLYSTCTGLVVKRFSSLHRAIADGFSLLLIYFVCDPIIFGPDFSDVPLTLVTFIIPMSSRLFSTAASELKALTEAS